MPRHFHRMKIVVISNMYPSEKDPSFGIFVKLFVDGLLDNGVDVELLVKKKEVRPWINLFHYFQFYLRVFIKIHKDSSSIFYVHYANHSLVPFIISKKNIIRRTIINFHGGDLHPRTTFNKVLSHLTQSVTKRAQHFVVPSQYLKDELGKRYDVFSKNVIISPSGGVDLSKFKPIKKSFTVDKLKLGYVGRLDEGKGIEVLLDALYKLSKSEVTFSASIVGGGMLFSYAVNKINKLGLSGCVEFFGVQSHDELAKIFPVLDVFIFPSFEESLGLVGIEAMSCGVPVIGSNIGGIASYVEDGKNGFLFKKGDSEDLVEKIIKFYQLTEYKRQELSENALKTAQSYDRRKISNDIFSFLRFVEKMWVKESTLH